MDWGVELSQASTRRRDKAAMAGACALLREGDSPTKVARSMQGQVSPADVQDAVLQVAEELLQTPDKLVCPITKAMMREPVMCDPSKVPAGFSGPCFERSALVSLCAEHEVEPPVLMPFKQLQGEVDRRIKEVEQRVPQLARHVAQQAEPVARRLLELGEDLAATPKARRRSIQLQHDLFGERGADLVELLAEENDAEALLEQYDALSVQRHLAALSDALVLELHALAKRAPAPAAVASTALCLAHRGGLEDLELPTTLLAQCADQAAGAQKQRLLEQLAMREGDPEKQVQQLQALALCDPDRAAQSAYVKRLLDQGLSPDGEFLRALPPEVLEQLPFATALRCLAEKVAATDPAWAVQAAVKAAQLDGDWELCADLCGAASAAAQVHAGASAMETLGAKGKVMAAALRALPPPPVKQEPLAAEQQVRELEERQSSRCAALDRRHDKLQASFSQRFAQLESRLAEQPEAGAGGDELESLYARLETLASRQDLEALEKRLGATAKPKGKDGKDGKAKGRDVSRAEFDALSKQQASVIEQLQAQVQEARIRADDATRRAEQEAESRLAAERRLDALCLRLDALDGADAAQSPALPPPEGFDKAAKGQAKARMQLTPPTHKRRKDDDALQQACDALGSRASPRLAKQRMLSDVQADFDLDDAGRCEESECGDITWTITLPSDFASSTGGGPSKKCKHFPLKENKFKFREISIWAEGNGAENSGYLSLSVAAPKGTKAHMIAKVDGVVKGKERTIANEDGKFTWKAAPKSGVGFQKLLERAKYAEVKEFSLTLTVMPQA